MKVRGHCDTFTKETKINPRVKVIEKGETNGCNEWIIICNCRGVAEEIKCAINILLYNAPLLVIANTACSDCRVRLCSHWLNNHFSLTRQLLATNPCTFLPWFVAANRVSVVCARRPYCVWHRTEESVCQQNIFHILPQNPIFIRHDSVALHQNFL